MPSVCFVHDWLTGMRGGEKVLEAMVELFPDAPIFTLFMKRANLSPELKKRTIHTSFLQYIPGITRIYRWLLPAFPLAITLFNVRAYDIVISSNHCVAKGVRTREDALHICYCHTPMRYLWGMSNHYFGHFPSVLQKLIELYFRFLKKWDQKTSSKVHLFIANSKNIQNKISQIYDRESCVIYPPVDVPQNSPSDRGQYFLIVSALVEYKKIDLAIEAFNRLRLPLKIVGDGPLKAKLEKLIRFNGINFEGWLDEKELQKRYEHALALVFPGEEDFGIVPVEAQMYGKPVIAFGSGGVMESVTEKTGIFFHEPDPNALCEAVRTFQKLSFDPLLIQNHAKRFSRDRFQQEFSEMFEKACRAECVGSQ